METLQRRAFSGFEDSMCKTQTDCRTEAIIGNIGGGTSVPPGEVFDCVVSFSVAKESPSCQTH